jgi:hypothetical protein
LKFQEIPVLPPEAIWHRQPAEVNVAKKPPPHHRNGKATKTLNALYSPTGFLR